MAIIRGLFKRAIRPKEYESESVELGADIDLPARTPEEAAKLAADLYRALRAEGKALVLEARRNGDPEPATATGLIGSGGGWRPETPRPPFRRIPPPRKP